MVDLALDKSLEVPLSGGLELINLLKLSECVSVDELGEAHVASSDSYDELAVHNLGVNSPGSEKVESISKSPDGHTDLHGVDVLSQHFIH